MPVDTPLTYVQNPRPVGYPITYRLSGDRLVVDSTRKVDEVRLGAVTQVRLSYEPRSFAQRAYRTKLTLSNGRSVAFSSLSWTSLIEAKSQGPEYNVFVRALVAAVAAANPEARLVAGKPMPLWVAVGLLAGFSLLGIALFTWRAAVSGATAAAVLGALIGAAGVWQLEPMVRLNKPRRFTPERVPDDLLP